MRIFLTTDTVGGVWDYTVTLSMKLREEGHSVFLAIVGAPSTEQLLQLPEGLTIESRNHPLEWMKYRTADLPRTAQWLSRTARGWRADVVHLNQMAYTGMASFSAPTLVVVHSDTCSWFSEVLGEALPADRTEYGEIVARGLRAADVVVTPSRYQAELTERWFGRIVDRVIHNGAPPPSDEPRIRKGPLIVSVGRAWDKAKGVEVYDRAVEMLGASAPPAYVIGEAEGPPESPPYRPTAVKSVGRVESGEVCNWMSRATIYVAASIYEPFGLAPLEAAGRGCALILSDIGSFREIWEGAALFFEKGNAASLAGALRSLSADGGKVSTLRAAARKRALTLYTDERFANEYLELYRWMAPASTLPRTGRVAAATPS